MKNVIVISRCLKIKKSSQIKYIFHFKGVYLGLQVNSMELTSETVLKVGRDYLMRVQVRAYEDGILMGNILTAHDLDDITSH